MIRTAFALVLSLVFALLSSLTLAAEPREGVDYTLVNPPQNTLAGKGKIEVIEFFSYACPHCKAFNPLVTAWAAKLPKDVSFRRVPVQFGRAPWGRLAKIYYALEITGDLHRLDDAVFRALHDERVPFNSDEQVVAWAVSKGVDGKKMADAMSSFSTMSRIQRAEQEERAYRISGIPTLAVNGRYLVASEGVSHPAQLEIADRLIAKARQESKGK